MNKTLVIFGLLVALLLLPFGAAVAQDDPGFLEECIGEPVQFAVIAIDAQGQASGMHPMSDNEFAFFYSLEGTRHDFIGERSDVPSGKEPIRGVNFGFEGIGDETIFEARVVILLLRQPYGVFMTAIPDDFSQFWLTPILYHTDEDGTITGTELLCGASFHVLTGLTPDGQDASTGDKPSAAA